MYIIEDKNFISKLEWCIQCIKTKNWDEYLNPWSTNFQVKKLKNTWTYKHIDNDVAWQAFIKAKYASIFRNFSS